QNPLSRSGREKVSFKPGSARLPSKKSRKVVDYQLAHPLSPALSRQGRGRSGSSKIQNPLSRSGREKVSFKPGSARLPSKKSRKVVDYQLAHPLSPALSRQGRGRSGGTRSRTS